MQTCEVDAAEVLQEIGETADVAAELAATIVPRLLELERRVAEMEAGRRPIVVAGGGPGPLLNRAD